MVLGDGVYVVVNGHSLFTCTVGIGRMKMEGVRGELVSGCGRGTCNANLKCRAIMEYMNWKIQQVEMLEYLGLRKAKRWWNLFLFLFFSVCVERKRERHE